MELKKYEENEQLQKDGESLIEFNKNIEGNKIFRDSETMFDELHIEFLSENIASLDSIHDYNLVKRVFDFLKRS